VLKYGTFYFILGCGCQLLGIRLSHSKVAALVSKIGDFPFLKVIDLYPGADAEGMLAVGLVNGKVILSSFGSSLAGGNREYGEILI
jgi:hypothetical protein